jgi:hypothetical protein
MSAGFAQQAPSFLPAGAEAAGRCCPAIPTKESTMYQPTRWRLAGGSGAILRLRRRKASTIRKGLIGTITVGIDPS